MVQWWLQYCRGTKWVQFYIRVHVFDLKIRMSNWWFGIQKVLHLLSSTPLPLHSYPKCTKQCIQFFSIVSFILHKIWYFLYDFQRVKILTENKKYLSVNLILNINLLYNVILMTNGCIFVCKSDMSHSINILAWPHAHGSVSEESTNVFFSLNQYMLQKNIIIHQCTLGSILRICIVNCFPKNSIKESLLDTNIWILLKRHI